MFPLFSRYFKVTGDVLLSSGVVAYLGPFTVDFRNVSASQTDTHRQTGILTETYRQTHRQTDRLADRQIHRETYDLKQWYINFQMVLDPESF